MAPAVTGYSQAWKMAMPELENGHARTKKHRRWSGAFLFADGCWLLVVKLFNCCMIK
jgi:hypothetical protein